MNRTAKPYPARAAIGLVAAVAIGFAVIAACNTVWAVVEGVPVTTLWEDDAVWAQIVIAAAPYLLLALLGVGARRPWIVALCLTAAFWGFYLFVITRPYEGGGANIGLGLLMIFSPLPITAASLIALATVANRRGPDAIAADRDA
ncbi:hypothetical protein OF829_01780 [Sphingomonas sp. LB-2]|uniref:hypothetical protein n=1 Tax=Sphingomonas caeni TaxID=2984949 RepID=UPI0022303429|nr:hypothetical protein [Sphingomonas caeni]MCW3845954.1 hypothetical protein [Sphingomonas caeni]